MGLRAHEGPVHLAPMAYCQNMRQSTHWHLSCSFSLLLSLPAPHLLYYVFAFYLSACNHSPTLQATMPAAAGSSVRSFSAQLSAHRVDDQNNSAESPFDFTEENYKIVKVILSKYPKNYKQSAIIPLLDLAQRQCGNFVPLAAMNKVAEVVGVPPVRVYEVASFYTMFNRERVGKYFIQLCGTTPCMVNGSEEIKQTIEKHLGIHEGGEQQHAAEEERDGEERRGGGHGHCCVQGSSRVEWGLRWCSIPLLTTPLSNTLPFPFLLPLSLSSLPPSLPLQRPPRTACSPCWRWSAWVLAPMPPWFRSTMTFTSA